MYKFLILVCILLISCFSCRVEPPPSPAYIAKQRVAAAVKRAITDKYGVRLSGFGGGITEAGIRKVNLSFHRRGEPLSKDEARILIIEAALIMIDLFNHDEEIRPYFMNGKFDSDNIHLTFFLMDKDGRSVVYPEIVVVSTVYKNVEYKYKSLEKKHGYALIEEESFEEAVAIAQSQGYEFDPHLLALSLGEIHDNAVCTSFSGQ